MDKHLKEQVFLEENSEKLYKRDTYNPHWLMLWVDFRCSPEQNSSQICRRMFILQQSKRLKDNRVPWIKCVPYLKKFSSLINITILVLK